MDFTYNDEQRMLTDALRRLVADHWSFEKRRARAQREHLDHATWAALADIGITGLLIPEQLGGFGESPATLIATQLELGRGLVSEPTIPSAVMATTLLLHSSNTAVQEQWLPALAGGQSVGTIAYLEDDQRDTTTPHTTVACTTKEGFVLNGTKKLVWNGAQANFLAVSARLNNDTVLLLAPADHAGVSLRDYPTMDGYRCASLELDNVQLESSALIARGPTAQHALEQALDYGIAALCGHAAGAAQRLVEITTAYLKTRHQFGRALSEFQSLQHELADMLLNQELAISMAYVAAMALAENPGPERQRLLSSAKIAIAGYGQRIGESAVQLHGGIGMTHELEVGDYFKRLKFTGYLLGSTDHHLARLQTLFEAR